MAATTRDDLIAALTAERDAALDEAAFERQHATLALGRVEKLLAEVRMLQGQLRTALSGAPPVAQSALEAEVSDLRERLHLAVDTSRRLERDRSRLERELDDARQTARLEHEQVERLKRRLRALEGALRMAQVEAPDISTSRG